MAQEFKIELNVTVNKDVIYDMAKSAMDVVMQAEYLLVENGEPVLDRIYGNFLTLMSGEYPYDMIEETSHMISDSRTAVTYNNLCGNCLYFLNKYFKHEYES